MGRQIVGHKAYLTAEGDMFDALALAAYGEEGMAHCIIQANPDYGGVLVFGAGAELRIPVVEGAETPQTLAPWRRQP